MRVNSQHPLALHLNNLSASPQYGSAMLEFCVRLLSPAEHGHLFAQCLVGCAFWRYRLDECGVGRALGLQRAVGHAHAPVAHATRRFGTQSARNQHAIS